MLWLVRVKASRKFSSAREWSAGSRSPRPSAPTGRPCGPTSGSRGASSDTELDGVTIYQLASDFTLTSRLDAKVMRHLQGDEWELTDVRERTFSDTSQQQFAPVRRQHFPGTKADTFRIRPGRPEQMQLTQLTEQARLRAGVGLPTRRFELAWHQRFTNALIGVVAAVLAAAFASGCATPPPVAFLPRSAGGTARA